MQQTTLHAQHASAIQVCPKKQAYGAPRQHLWASLTALLFVGMACALSHAQPKPTASAAYGDGPFTETISPASGLHHPGTLQDAALLRALKRSLDAKDPKRLELWKQMVTSPRGRIDKRKQWAPPRDLKGREWSMAAKMSAAGSMRYALEWVMTRNPKADKAAIEILNAWAAVRSFTPDATDRLRHHRLVGGINLGYLPCAAELLMSSGTSWPEAEQQRFKTTWRKTILPIVAAERPNPYNGNWDLACAWTILASAVMLDDRALFDSEIERLRHAKTNACFTIYLLPSGQCQETGRDVGHSQMGLYFASLCAQIAWSQGIDLYEGDDYSLGRCYEYLAMFQQGEDRLPYEIYNDAIGRSSRHQSPVPSAKGRGKFQKIYEMVYHHYRDYRGTELPHVRKVLEEHTRPEAPGPNTNMWSTLCYWDLDLTEDAKRRGAKPADVTVRLVGK